MVIELNIIKKMYKSEYKKKKLLAYNSTQAIQASLKIHANLITICVKNFFYNDIRSYLLRGLLLMSPNEQRIFLDGQMRRVQRVGVRLSVTPMVIRVALSATEDKSEK